MEAEVGVLMSVSKERQLYDEIRELRAILEHIEALLEERLLGIDEPLPDEVNAIKEYEDDKKKGKVELINLDDILERKDD
ncbi:MAG: hypothetical protein J7L55_03150 [Desulfurococcales archaeon]|nr:hypothetical protein [Desulfurococcales archaeon]